MGLGNIMAGALSAANVALGYAAAGNLALGRYAMGNMALGQHAFSFQEALSSGAAFAAFVSDSSAPAPVRAFFSMLGRSREVFGNLPAALPWILATAVAIPAFALGASVLPGLILRRRARMDA
jgi:hypothetical protein